MSEREDVKEDESAAGDAEVGLADRSGAEGRLSTEMELSLGGAERIPNARKRRRPAKRVVESEVFLDVPLQARSLERLSWREGARYWRARKLLAAGGGPPHALARADITLAGLGVYEALLERSWAIRLHDPAMMIHLAEAAADVAEGFDPRGYGARRVADFRARAWGELANAYRAADRLRSAQQTFGQAYFWLHRGTGDPYLKARLFDLEASLLGVLREYPLALQRLASLVDVYQELGETHLAGRAAMKQALYTYYSGEVIPAFELNAQGMVLMDRERDPIVYMMAVHNHLLYLVDLGQYSRARRLLFENQRNLIYKNRVMALRLRGIEGQINYGLGKLMSAEIAFREQKEGLADLGMGFYCALATLHLAMALLSQNRIEEAEAEVIEVREIFLAQELYREHLGAVIFLEECFRRRKITVGLIHKTVAYLHRVDLNVEPHKLRT